MVQRGVTSRLVSPVGFVAVLVCLAFPFVAVSCEGPNSTTVVEYTGVDLAFGGYPTMTVNGVPKTPGHDMRADPQLVMILAVVTIGCGLTITALSLLRLGVAASPRWAAAGCATAAGATTVLLIINQLIVRDRIVYRLSQGGRGNVAAAEQMVETRPAFWLALIFLCVIVIAGSAEYLRGIARRHAAPAGGGPPPPTASFPT